MQQCPWLRPFHSCVARQLSSLSCLSTLDLWQWAACHLRAFGWDAASASQEKLNYFSVPHSYLDLSWLRGFCSFLWLWQKRKLWWVKCWKNFLNVWKHPHFTCRFLLSCFPSLFFQVSCVSPIAEAVFVALMIACGSVLYRAVGLMCTHSWQTGQASLPAEILRVM